MTSTEEQKFKMSSLLESLDLPRLVQVDKDVVQMPIAQSDDVANHGHDGEGATNVLNPGPPLLTCKNFT